MEAPLQGRRQACAAARRGGGMRGGPSKAVYWVMVGLTGVALVALVALGIDLASTDWAPAVQHTEAGANATLVRRFYDAVNTTVVTGDPAPLADVVAADFVNRPALPGLAPGRGGLVQHLLALRATFPTLWLDAEELHPHGDWVLAHLRAEGTAPGAFLGLGVAGAPGHWVATELLRVADGRVAERRSGGEWPVLPQPLAEALLPEPAATAFVRLGRLTYGPGASQLQTAIPGLLLVAVEAGALSVVLEGEAVLTRAAAAGTRVAPSASAPPAGEVVLSAGDALALSAGAEYAVRNAGQAPAVVLTLALFPESPGALAGTPSVWWESWVPDVHVQPLAEGVVEGLPSGPTALALGRITLAAQAELNVDGTSVARLAAVEAGSLDLTTAARTTTTLWMGQGTLVEPATALTLGNAGDGPVTLLLVTVAPAS